MDIALALVCAHRSLYPAEYMDVYELKDIEEETKRIKEKIASFIELPFRENLGTTIGLYSQDCLMIPGWCNRSDINYYQVYTENYDFQEVYNLIYKGLNIAELQKHARCKNFDTSNHLRLLREALNTIIRFENISFDIPCFETPFPYETVRFSDNAEDICESDFK